MRKGVTAGGPGRLRRVALTAALTVALGASSAARDLKSHTVAAFDRYQQLTEARMAAEVAGTSPFLWIDRQPARERTALMTRLKAGEVVIERLETKDGTESIVVRDGLVHHWVGTVFLPGVTIDRLTAFAQDYARYDTVFSPTVQRAKVLTQRPDHFDVAIRTYAHKVITVVLDTDYNVEYRRVSPTREYTKSAATNIFEVADPGKPTEKRRPSAQGTGFLWRLANYCLFEERAEGTYEQCESLSLTRDAPFGLGWMIKPFITGIPRETLEFTLGRVRANLTR